jgi:hypothetical protein
MKLARAWTAVMLLSLAAAGCDLCGNQEITRIPSPDGKIEAVLFERDCGATTNFSAQISVVPKGAPAEGIGNVFVGGTYHGPTWLGPPANVKWVTSRLLIISIHPGTRMFARESAVFVRTGLLTHEKVEVGYFPGFK